MRVDLNARSASADANSKKNEINLDVCEMIDTGIYLEPEVMQDIVANKLRFGDFRRWRIAENGIEGTRVLSIIQESHRDHEL